MISEHFGQNKIKKKKKKEEETSPSSGTSLFSLSIWPVANLGFATRKGFCNVLPK